jgi:outer membrane lipoprotein-sorting protein
MRISFFPGNGPMALAGLVLALGVGNTLRAQDAAVAKVDEKAAKIMDAYVEALGGAEALDKFESRQFKGKFKMPAAGMEAPLTISQQAPNKQRTMMELPGIGKIEQVCDGEQVFDKNPLTGERMLSGGEKEAVLMEADFDADANWRKRYKSIEFVGEAEVDGSDCYQLEMVSSGGQQRTAYFDQETNLMIKVEMTVDSPQGKLATVSRLKDYREVDGIKYPFTTELSLMGQTQIIQIESVEHGVDFPADTFAIPSQDG